MTLTRTASPAPNKDCTDPRLPGSTRQAGGFGKGSVLPYGLWDALWIVSVVPESLRGFIEPCCDLG
jgi:hypothetical protein